DGSPQAGPDRADGGDGGGTEREAGDQHAEAPDVAVQIEQADANPVEEAGHAAGVRSRMVSWPRFMTRTRSARSARSGSWVMSSMAVPCWRARSNISLMTRSPDSWSRLPVGSSASISRGRVTMARARP